MCMVRSVVCGGWGEEEQCVICRTGAALGSGPHRWWFACTVAPLLPPPTADGERGAGCACHAWLCLSCIRNRSRLPSPSLTAAARLLPPLSLLPPLPLPHLGLELDDERLAPLAHAPRRLAVLLAPAYGGGAMQRRTTSSQRCMERCTSTVRVCDRVHRAGPPSRKHERAPRARLHARAARGRVENSIARHSPLRFATLSPPYATKRPPLKLLLHLSFPLVTKGAVAPLTAALAWSSRHRLLASSAAAPHHKSRRRPRSRWGCCPLSRPSFGA